MDAALAEMFARTGGELITARREPVQTGEGIVRATGRRPQTEEGGWRLFGLKAHASGVKLAAGLEMHFTPRGYVGLCAVEDGWTNVCGLFRSRVPVPTLAQDWKSWLCGEPGSALHSRLADAHWNADSFSSVAALSLAPRAIPDDELSIGDAVTMIPPVTGNGMSMACESAAAAIVPLTRWARGECDWSAARSTLADTLRGQFSARLKVAALLQKAILSAPVRGAVFQTVRAFPSLQDMLFRATR
jgi:2-polyprenyl-6-methoxyphenol hydroxylase-like FAD-dependent oxidoreductase